MKFIYALLSTLILSACATHTPAPEPKGTPFPINDRPLIHISTEKNHG